MADKTNRIAYTGNMDKDSDVRYVGKGNNAGDGLDARNIQAVDAEGNVQGSIPPTLGNEFAFDLGSVSQQNKRYRIFLDGDATKQHAVRFMSTQRDANILVGTGPFPGQAVEFNGTVASCVAALQAAGNAGVMSFSATATTVDITMTAYPMYQWYAESVGTDVVQVICVAEAIPVDLAGPLKDIGSYDLLGDLFIFSTTQDNEPTEIAPQIILVGPTSGGTYIGPLTRLLFNGNHGLVQGQWIRITGSNEAFLNGLFVVNAIISPTQLEIVTVTAWGVNPPVTTLGTPQVFIHPTGIGEIGVAQKNEDTDTWTYTRLLRSVELNFVSKWQIDCDGRSKGGRNIIYYTDFYNNIRYTSYKGQYIQDGLLAFVNSDNFMIYDSIDVLSLASSQSVFDAIKINYVSQSNTGGGLTPGNKRYVFQLVSRSGAEFDWSDLSGAIPVYREAFQPSGATRLKGNDPSEPPTTKVNNLLITGIPRGLFKEVAVACVEINGEAVSAYKFITIQLGDNDTSVSFAHTGLEDEQELIDVGQLVITESFLGRVKKAKSLSIIDKRLVLGNVVYDNYADIKLIAEAITHRLDYREVSGVGKFFSDIIANNNSIEDPAYIAAGGFLDPGNVFNFPSLTLNETYRVGVDFTLRDGTVSPVFWVDDIRIDTEPLNTANPSDNRRISGGGLPNYILQSDDPSNSFGLRVPYIKFSNIDPDSPVGGISFKQIVASVRFRFAKVRREVLASGHIIMGCRVTQSNPQTYRWRQGGSIITDTEGPNNFVPYPVWNDRWMTTNDFGGATTNLAQTTIPDSGTGTPFPSSFAFPGGPFDPSDALGNRRRFAAFYSPEISMGKMDDYIPTPADKIYVYYPVKRQNPYILNDSVRGVININTGVVSVFGNGNQDRLFDSSTTTLLARNASTPLGQLSDEQHCVSFRSVPILASKILLPGESALIGTSNFSNRIIERIQGVLVPPIKNDSFGTTEGGATLDTAKCLAINASEGIWPADTNPLSGDQTNRTYWSDNNTDRGVYYAQIVRESPNKYGNKEGSDYSLVSSSFSVNVFDDPQTEVDVFGEDSFLSMVLYRQRFKNTNVPSSIIAASQFSNLNHAWQYGRSIGVAYFCQTYMNMGLINRDVVQTDPNPSFPESYQGSNNAARRNEWVRDGRGQNPLPPFQGEYIQFYNEAYSFGFSSLKKTGFLLTDADIIRELPARIVWSERDVYSSVTDSMIIFPPINIHDLDTTWGAIHEISNVNGELLTLQPRKWQRQYFNARGVLESSNNSVNVLLGSGDVMSRDGETLSSYGTEHQWSVVKGRSDGGKDVLYWFNAENGLFMRFGADGTVVISDRSRFRSYANRAAKWLRGKDTPAFDQGIRAVWDDRSKEVIWTFTGWRNVSEWARPGIIIPSTVQGTVVVNSNAPSDTYEGLPRFFRCLLTHVPSSLREPGVGAEWETFWEQIAYDDFDYYSVFTVALNETTNGFKTFYGHIPKTYLKWRDTFLSSHPTRRNLIFEHRRGLPTTWYGRHDIAPKVEDAHVEMVVNELPEQTTRGVAVRFLSKLIPQRVDYRTERHHTWDEAAQFRRDNDQWIAPIRKDATVTGTPVSGGDILTGEYLRVKFTIFGGTYNLLHSIVVKFMDRARRINR